MTAYRRMKLGPYLSPYTKINSQWVKDLIVKHETQKTLQQKVQSMPQYVAGTGKDFINWTLLPQTTRQTVDKWDFVKLKGSALQRKQLIKRISSPQNWRKSSQATNLTDS